MKKKKHAINITIKILFGKGKNIFNKTVLVL